MYGAKLIERATEIRSMSSSISVKRFPRAGGRSTLTLSGWSLPRQAKVRMQVHQRQVQLALCHAVRLGHFNVPARDDSRSR